MSWFNSPSRIRALFALAVSVALAIGSILVVYRVIRTAEQEVIQAKAPSETMEVLVAVRDLHVGVAITAEDVALRSFPPQMVPREGAITSIAGGIGRIPRERILVDEIVRDQRLALAEAGIGLNALISPGKRAMSVVVDAESGVAGFILPGNFVDVLVTIRPDDQSSERSWFSVVMLQGVKVLAVGRSMGDEKAPDEASQRTNKSAQDRPTVTLEVDLTEAQDLALASSRGDLHIVLRNDIDLTEEQIPGVNASGLVSQTPPAPPRQSRRRAQRTSPNPIVSEVISGSQVREIRFQADGSRLPATRSTPR